MKLLPLLAATLLAVPVSVAAQTSADGAGLFPGALADYRGMPRQKPGSDKICLQRKRGGGTVCHSRERWWRLAAKPPRRR